MSAAQKILLVGQHRAGKSSIQQVVFHKMSPNETLFLPESYSAMSTPTSPSAPPPVTPFHHDFIKLDIVDLPASQLDQFYDPFYVEQNHLLTDVKCIIFVIDAQDDYTDALSKLFIAATRANQSCLGIVFEVFVHKVDGLSDDHKIEIQRDIQQRITDELADAGLEMIQINYHLTSIYDHSIYEAFSKVIQKLVREVATFENLLNALWSNSAIEKAYLFDILTKVYVATDSSPVDMASYAVACDMIDVILDIRFIYGSPMKPAHTIEEHSQEQSTLDEQVVIETQSPSHLFQNLSATINLNNGSVFHLTQVSPKLALVCLIRGDHFRNKRGWIEVNFERFRQAFQSVVDVIRMK